MGPDAAGVAQTLDHIQTLALRYDPTTDQCRISPSKAIREADLDPSTPLRYLPERADTLGVVPALPVTDGTPSNERTYSIVERGNTGTAFQLTLSPETLDALGIDSDGDDAAVRGPSPPLLDVYAGAGVLALDRAASVTLPAELSTSIERGGEGLTLKSTQTTVPRTHGSSITASITPAFNRAGGNFEALEFLPKLAADLDGLVVGVGRDESRSGGTNTRSILRGGPNKQGAAVSLSDDVLAALDLSPSDFEDGPRSDYPSVAVLTGTGVIGFARPGQRTISW